jgi:hypothetical protein
MTAPAGQRRRIPRLEDDYSPAAATRRMDFLREATGPQWGASAVTGRDDVPLPKTLARTAEPAALPSLGIGVPVCPDWPALLPFRGRG